MATRPSKWRILAILTGPSLNGSAGPDCDGTGLGCIDEFSSLKDNEAELLTLKTGELATIGKQISDFKPNFIYVSTGTQAAGETAELQPFSLDAGTSEADGALDQGAASFLELLTDPELDTVFFDCVLSQDTAEAARKRGVPNVLFWPQAASALHAAHFGHALFAVLRCTTAILPEAFAVAAHSGQAHCTLRQGAAATPLMPELLADVSPKLPDMDGIPLPELEGTDLSKGVQTAVPGWDNVRLLAPHAELKMQACGQSPLIDAHRLSFLGEALRGVLVLDLRQLTVTSTAPCERTPTHLPSGCTALRCSIASTSGALATVILGGPPDVLSNASLVEHALRNTLVADALSLQFRLPPPNAPPPTASSSVGLAGGAPCVSTLLVTSVWAVHLLRLLALNEKYRALVALGVAGIGSSTTASFSHADSVRYASLSAAQLASAADAAAAPGGQAGSPGATVFTARNAGLSKRASAELDGPEPTANGAGPRPKRQKRAPAAEGLDWHSQRGRLSQCSEKAFLADVCAFLQAKQGRKVEVETFPDAILNGRPLDLFALYKEVVRRGGYSMGNGINWKGQVFPHMRNFTASHKMTGVGNALKRHYANFLEAYEAAHPEDVGGEGCSICGGGEDVSADWISCDKCESWAHFSCDKRPSLGPFKEYAKGEGHAVYICPKCAPEQGKEESS